MTVFPLLTPAVGRTPAARGPQTRLDEGRTLVLIHAGPEAYRQNWVMENTWVGFLLCLSLSPYPGPGGERSPRPQ